MHQGDTNAQQMIRQLKEVICGEVRSDSLSRGIYATDASHYQVVPQVVVCPRDEQDVIRAVRIAAKHQVAITARGAGTSLSGQTTWDGMILDFSKFMNQIIEVNYDEQWVVVQPGMVRDQLNASLKADGLHFAPDPATTSRATIGGMMGNNAAGMHSIRYGQTSDSVLECRVLLADGTILDCLPTDLRQWKKIESGSDRIAGIHKRFHQLIAANQDEIGRRFPKIMRRVAGYALDSFLVGEDKDPIWNLADLMVGSEGTLGVLLSAKLRLNPLPPATGLCVVHFNDRIEALAAVGAMLKHEPAAIELIDNTVLEEARINRSSAAMCHFLEGEPDGIQIVEFFGDSEGEVRQKLESFSSDMQQQKLGYAWPTFHDEKLKADVWGVRQLGLGLIFNKPGAAKGVACIEDGAVPADRLSEYMRQTVQICGRHGIELSLYGHASVGVIHARPRLDLHDPQQVELMEEITTEVYSVCKELGGCFSGEHGDGLLRGQFLKPFYGEKIYSAFREVKAIFDPNNLMNPGKIVDSPTMKERLRYGDDYAPEADSMFHYRGQGGFVGAVEQCVGVGACRKLKSGTMCPSYMATKDEEHSTRGRANALRMAISGQLGADAITGDRMQQALELCLSCKACKSECPTSVDMSRLKADVTHLRHQRFGISRADKWLGRAPNVARRFAGRWAGAFNWIQNSAPVRWYMERVAKVDRRRRLPALARESFATWWNLEASRRVEPQQADVVLFVDTFTNYYEPHVGQAAIHLLEGCGYQVGAIMGKCCQRPQISRGLLDEARNDGTQTLAKLSGIGKPIVVLEPSCASALTDDLPDLVSDSKLGATVASVAKLLDVFLEEEIETGRITPVFTSTAKKMLVHGHCHQKAIYGTSSMNAILARVDGLEFSEVDSGCCGMAGAFGYQQYELSEKIGEDRLFPAIRAAVEEGAEVVACGISCRHQIHDFLNVKAKHWVELVAVR